MHVTSLRRERNLKISKLLFLRTSYEPYREKMDGLIYLYGLKNLHPSPLVGR